MYRIGFEEEEAILRKKAEPVKEFTPQLKEYVNEMISFMREMNGVGLAAPQIGDSRRIFVCEAEEGNPMVFINPEILGTSVEENVYEEGCLSVPGIYTKVTRPESITIQAWNERGRPFTIEAGGFLATVVQHEFDHLNGVIFIDHIKERTREKLVKKYNKSMGIK